MIEAGGAGDQQWVLGVAINGRDAGVGSQLAAERRVHAPCHGRRGQTRDHVRDGTDLGDEAGEIHLRLADVVGHAIVVDVVIDEVFVVDGVAVAVDGC